MYVDSKPTATLGETQGWKMLFNPQPTGTVERPPIAQLNSSSSSLGDLEQAVPSFQSFVQRTPPIDQEKPLPPVPFKQRPRSSYSGRSETPRESSTPARRTSSIYSRTFSQWGPGTDSISWQSADFADDHNLLLRPIAYSASTPQLHEQSPTKRLCDPRAYSPLITDPSPTASRVSTPSPAADPRPSVALLPPPTDFAKIPKKHLRTVSLEKAIAALQAPGVEHLLPEELRARSLGKSRSEEPLAVRDTAVFFGSVTPPQLPEPVTFVDNYGRDRLLPSPRASKTPIPTFAICDADSNAYRKPSDSSLVVGDGSPKVMVSLANQPRKASKNKITQALGLSSFDEPRGRTGQRDYSHYLPNKREPSSSSSEERSDAQHIAKEYHSLLIDQYRQLSRSPAGHRTDSDTSVREQMKMVPQPLFHSRPLGAMSGLTSRHNGGSSLSPFHMRGDSTGDNNYHSKYNDRAHSRRSSLPRRLSLAAESSHRSRSTSGSIPISPPSARMTMSPIAPSAPLSLQRTRQTPKLRSGSVDERVSAYYPFVASRKGKKSKAKMKNGDAIASPQVFPVPSSAAEIVAQRLQTPETLPAFSPVQWRQHPDDVRSSSDAASEDAHQPLHLRLAKNAAKYADLLTRPAGHSSEPERMQYQPITLATINQASPESPHLLPSQHGSSQSPVRLGWSNIAKSSFDKARFPVQPSKPMHSSVTVTHTVTAARPLDESRDALEEPESPRRKSSVFKSLMEFRREAKADKRRTELKKMIRHVPQRDEDSNCAYVKRRLSEFGLI